MPAGEYVVQCTNPSSSARVLQIRRRDGQGGVLTQTNTVIGKLNDNARLVFNRYGNRYFFSQAWLPAAGNGMEAPSSREKAHQLAREKRTTETVVASSRR
jgi:hypothetical protein